MVYRSGTGWVRMWRNSSVRASSRSSLVHSPYLAFAWTGSFIKVVCCAVQYSSVVCLIIFSVFKVSPFFPLQVVLSPNSNWLFSASGDIRVWSVPKMLQQMQSDAMSRRHCCAIAGLTMNKDGSKAVAVSPDQSDGKPNGGLQLSIWETWRTWGACFTFGSCWLKHIERFYTTGKHIYLIIFVHELQTNLVSITLRTINSFQV
jgi:hypothetical protein